MRIRDTARVLSVFLAFGGGGGYPSLCLCIVQGTVLAVSWVKDLSPLKFGYYTISH